MKFTPTHPSAARPIGRLPASQGYRLSSEELHSGLDVKPLLFTSLPADLVWELVRMRKSWGTPPASGPDSRLGAL